MCFIEDIMHETVMDPGVYLVSIDNRIKVKDFGNFEQLPKRLQDELTGTFSLRSTSDEEVCGFDCDGYNVLSCEGYWSDGKFIVLSYGSHTCHWDGARVIPTVRTYV